MIALLLVGLALAFQEAPVQRIPEPDAESQKVSSKAVKDLFKAEYARKTPADQLDLARKLLTTSADASLDMTTKYVCLTEARDLAAGAGDATLALDAVSQIGKYYMVGVPAMKLAVLNRMAPLARDADRQRALGRAYYDLARESVQAEDYDTASAAASKAEPLLRGKEAGLTERVAELRKDLSTLKNEHQKVKAALDNPATGDADAVGRYLCFVRNEWASGLKLLAESGKGPVKDLAAKDLANPDAVESQVEVADGWWQLGQAEKMSWKKTHILGRSRRWYEMAQPNATALLKVRVNKRLVELEGATSAGVGGPAVNLLSMIDPERDTVRGEWDLEDGVLSSSGEQTLVLQIPYQPPEEYDLTVGVKRMGGTDSVGIGVVVAGVQAVICIDGYPTNGNALSGFEMVDGKILRDQATPAYKGKPLIEGTKPTVIVVQVRKSSLTLLVNGKRIGSMEGVAGRLSNRADSGTPDPKALFLGGWNGGMGFTEIRLTPLSGPGKKTK